MPYSVPMFVFFKYSTNKTEITSLLLIIIQAFMYLLYTVDCFMILILSDTSVTLYFRPEVPAMMFYYYYSACILATIILLTILPEMTYIPMIPFLILLIFVMAYKPYRNQRDNIRFCYNSVVILSFLSLRLFIAYYYPPQDGKRPLLAFRHPTVNHLPRILSVLLALCSALPSENRVG